MHQFFVEKKQIGENQITIEGEDVNHIKNVLRLQKGEKIAISNQVEHKYLCEIAEISKEKVIADILEVAKESTELEAKIYLFQGLPKSDKMEMIIQKAVELGVYKIIPVAMSRSIVRLDAQKQSKKQQRWGGISKSAAQQSKRMRIPEVEKLMSFDEAIKYAKEMEHILLPYELEAGNAINAKLTDNIKKGESIAIFIGPEGGFEEEEIENARMHGAKSISLGKRILRTETAGLAILSILMYHLET